ncbi:MAG: T9SS type A sorting domain-containing protein, partial [Bacteroidota bacterium]
LSNLSVVDIINPNPSVQLFPNPVHSVLTIETQLGEESGLSYRIEALNGQTIWSRDASESLRFQRLKIPVSSLPPGIYQVYVQSESGEQVQSFIKY